MPDKLPILPLDRPEYSKQTEALLTDLLWRSPGSTLFNRTTGKSYLNEFLIGREGPNGERLERIVLERIARRNPGSSKVIESLPIARQSSLIPLIEGDNDNECLWTLLESLKAPKSRSYTSISGVPLHPDLTVLQTLQGIVNKQAPPNVAGIIEHVGRLGGSDGAGAVASLFLKGANSRSPTADAGFTGFSNRAYPVIASHVWSTLSSMVQESGGSALPAWRSVGPQEYDPAGNTLGLATLKRTPFLWFWAKWVQLCDPDSGWIDFLPQRRWLDWSLTLLRTALAFAYLWEAEFLLRIRDRILERKDGLVDGPAGERLMALLGGQFTLVRVHPRSLPPSQKHVWNSLSASLGRGYQFRAKLVELLDDETIHMPTENPLIEIPKWLDELTPIQLNSLSEPLVVNPKTATNTKEFVKYLMLPRSADDDSSDQADLYFLAKSQGKNFWIDIGPEWLVVEAGLLSGGPNRKCTLRQLLDDLALLGIAVDRSTLVGLLEDTGLSADSPDADDALVIESGF